MHNINSIHTYMNTRTRRRIFPSWADYNLHMQDKPKPEHGANLDVHRVYLTGLAHQEPTHTCDIQASQIRVMLANAQEDHWNTCRMNHADQCTHHVTHSVALADNKSIQSPSRAKALVEVTCLGDRVRTHECLAHHEDLVRLRQLPEFLERRHEPLIVMPPSRSINEHYIEIGL